MSASTKTPATVEPKTNATEPKDGNVKPLSGLKSTPHVEPTEEDKAKTAALQIQLQIDDNLGEIEILTKLYRSYNKIDSTLRELKEFTHKSGDEDSSYGASTITITDGNRKEFKTQNPRLVQALVFHLNEILLNRKTELGKEIAGIVIKK